MIVLIFNPLVIKVPVNGLGLSLLFLSVAETLEDDSPLMVQSLKLCKKFFVILDNQKNQKVLKSKYFLSLS